VGGPGAQSPGALAAQPNGSAVYAFGSAWSAAQVRSRAYMGPTLTLPYLEHVDAVESSASYLGSTRFSVGAAAVEQPRTEI